VRIKHFLIAVVVLGFVGFIVFAPEGQRGDEQASRRPALEAPAPGFSLRDLSGRPWDLADLRGGVVVLNFWASWCTTCRSELPSLNALHEQSTQQPGLTVVTILYRDEPQKAADFMEKNGYTFPVLIDPEGAVAQAYGLTGVPETFVVDGKGVLRKSIIGPTVFDGPEALAYFRELALEKGS
jgi:DsbE subfamily thiol:disulfide oxidoreductase